MIARHNENILSVWMINCDILYWIEEKVHDIISRINSPFNLNFIN